MIPNFCKACGGRLEGRGNGYCLLKVCQNRARIDARVSTISAGSMSKMALVGKLERDLVKWGGVDCVAKELSILCAAVLAHPWDGQQLDVIGRVFSIQRMPGDFMQSSTRAPESDVALRARIATVAPLYQELL